MKEIITRDYLGTFRYTYSDFYRRTQRLANVLKDLGLNKGDRVATLAWNHHHHLELYLAVPVSGAVLHTLNLRLAPEQLVYIINHAEDKSRSAPNLGAHRRDVRHERDPTKHPEKPTFL
jgi:fatty-acyl-CoA synthase